MILIERGPGRETGFRMAQRADAWAVPRNRLPRPA